MCAPEHPPPKNSSPSNNQSKSSSSQQQEQQQQRDEQQQQQQKLLNDHENTSSPSPTSPNGVATTTGTRRTLVRRQTSISEASLHATTGSVVSAAVLLFSAYFPFFMAPWAAKETYQTAWYIYDPTRSVFCNSIWTYGTDYALALWMLLLISTISTKNKVSKLHAQRSRGLLGCYALSVVAGGMAHQLYTTLDSRNSWHFRFVWTVCVGSVTAASAWMGSIGSELARLDHDGYKRSGLPVIPESFWIAFGIFVTAYCAAGGMSFQRPACDIFIAGITQFPSTFYMMLLLGVGLPELALSNWTRMAGVIGFILNAPLLPLYPLLVQYTDWSPASINTLCHAWLLVGWGLQGIVLRRVEQALVQHHDAEQVPMKLLSIPQKSATTATNHNNKKASSSSSSSKSSKTATKTSSTTAIAATK